MENIMKYLLRIDEDLKLYIARQARLNDRSLNKEINFRLRLSKKLDNLSTMPMPQEQHEEQDDPAISSSAIKKAIIEALSENHNIQHSDNLKLLAYLK